MLQNLLYFVNKKTRSCFRFSFHATLYFYLMNAYVDIDQGIKLSANLLFLKSAVPPWLFPLLTKNLK